MRTLGAAARACMSGPGVLLAAICCAATKVHAANSANTSAAAPQVRTAFGTLVGSTVPAAVNDTNADPLAPPPEPHLNVSEFVGIPYAYSPRRWCAPVDWAEPYAGGLRPATTVGDVCVQQSSLAEPTFSPSLNLVGSEDCLFLNVWAPQPIPEFDPERAPTQGSLKPVLLWIHGGGLESGSGSMPLYNGSTLASKYNMLVVTLNYRLGVFGFLSLKTDVAHNRSTGNWGILDQLSAMRWVHAQIAAFGGDPARVLLFGESAGALSVCTQLLLPASKGLYAAALMESRTCTAVTPHTAFTDDDFASSSDHMANQTSCAQAGFGPVGPTGRSPAEDCLRQLPTTAVLSAAVALGSDWLPVVDGVLLPAPPSQLIPAGKFADVPIVTGTNTDEGMLFTLPTTTVVPAMVHEAAALCPSNKTWDQSLCYLPTASRELREELLSLYPAKGRAFSDGGNAQNMQQLITDRLFVCPSRAFARHASSRGTPTWVYQWNYTDSNRGIGDAAAPTHARELPFVFGTFGALELAPPTRGEAALANSMQVLWTNFARFGTPNGDGRVAMPWVEDGAWPRYESKNESLIVFDWVPEPPLNIQTGGRRDKWCDFWEKVCPDGRIFDDSCGVPDAISSLLVQLSADNGAAIVSALLNDTTITPRCDTEA